MRSTYGLRRNLFATLKDYQNATVACDLQASFMLINMSTMDAHFSDFLCDLMPRVAQYLGLQDWIHLVEACPRWSHHIGTVFASNDYAWINMDMSKLVSLKSIIAPNVITILNVKWPPNLTQLHCPMNDEMSQYDFDRLPISLTDLDLSNNGHILADRLPPQLVHIRMKKNQKFEHALDEFNLPPQLSTLDGLRSHIADNSKPFQWPLQLSYLNFECCMNASKLPKLPETLQTLIFKNMGVERGTNRLSFDNCIAQLPRQLKHLTVIFCDIYQESCMKDLPSTLETLDVTHVDFMSGSDHIPSFTCMLPLTLKVFKCASQLTLNMIQTISHRLPHLETLSFKNMIQDVTSSVDQLEATSFPNLKYLEVSQVSRVDRSWLQQLPRRLERLEIIREEDGQVVDIATFSTLPKSLTRLELLDNCVPDHPIHLLGNLRKLHLRSRRLCNWPQWLTNVPSNIIDLQIIGNLPDPHCLFHDIVFPSSLERLYLGEWNQVLPSHVLPKSLVDTNCHIQCTTMHEIRTLPKNLTRLNLTLHDQKCDDVLFAALPRRLKTLEIRLGNHQHVDPSADMSNLPPTLEELAIACLTARQVKHLPMSLRYLHLYHVHNDNDILLYHCHPNLHSVKMPQDRDHPMRDHYDGWSITKWVRYPERDSWIAALRLPIRHRPNDA